MKITVRFVKDHSDNTCWFEQLTEDGKNWHKIHETHYGCEGNSRHELSKYIMKLRERHFAIMRSYGGSESFEVYPDKFDEERKQK